MLEALLVLTLNIFNEAGNQPHAGKVAVAEVVMNRVGHKGFPDTIKGVIYQKNAFSWTLYKSTPKTPKAAYLLDPQRFMASYAAATQVYFTGERTLPKSTLFFYADYIKQPYWAKGATAKKIGNHYFVQKENI